MLLNTEVKKIYTKILSCYTIVTMICTNVTANKQAQQGHVRGR
jgi:hypothetical protein